MMELSDLYIFRTVVRSGGVTRAARQLHRVQSSVTKRIKALEDELQVELFIRIGKRLRLSPSGQVLLEYAEQLLALADRARDALHSDKPRGLMRLGTMESTAAVRLPAPLAEFLDRYPDVVLELDTGPPQELIARVLSGDLDAALVAEPVSDKRLEALPIFKEELAIVSGLKHPPIKSAHDVSLRTALAFHPGCPHRQRLENWFARDSVPIERMIELASYHTMLGCLVIGMGVALMPLSVLETYSERSRLQIHPLPEKFRWVRTLLVWPKQASQVRMAALSEVLLAHAAVEAAGRSS